jgi:hypothetical protein
MINKISSGWIDGMLLPIDHLGVVATYSYIAAPVYTIAPSTLTVSIFNGFLASLVIYNIYRIVTIIYDSSRAAVISLIATLYPSFIHYTSILMRDSLIIFISSEIIFILVIWIINDKTPTELLVLLPTALLLRPENVAYLLPAVVVAAILRFDIRRSTGKKTIIITSAIMLISIIVLLLLVSSSELIPLSPDALSAQRNHLSRDTGGIGGNYLGSIEFSNWIDVISFLPIGGIYYLLVPLPWMIDISNTFMIVALVENIVLLYPVIILFLLRIIKSGGIAKPEILLLTVLVAGMLSYGLVEGNMGPAMRHRLQFTYIIFILITPKIPIIIPFPASRNELPSRNNQNK